MSLSLRQERTPTLGNPLQLSELENQQIYLSLCLQSVLRLHSSMRLLIYSRSLLSSTTATFKSSHQRRRSKSTTRIPSNRRSDDIERSQCSLQELESELESELVLMELLSSPTTSQRSVLLSPPSKAY